MKNLLTLATACCLFTACNQDELERSHQQKDSLINVLTQRSNELEERESSINEFISSFNEVERNLDSVSIKQQIIYVDADKSRGDLKKTQKDRINEQIHAINNLMEENRKTISQLQRKLKGSSKLNNKLKETIATLNEQIQQKDRELAALNEKLLALNAQVAQLQTSVDTLTAQNNRRASTIADNTIAMHTAYYVVGRSKDLQAAKLIDRKGGLLGLGKTSRISSSIDNSKFTRIDYTQTSTIPVNSKGVSIITAHPADSYKLDTDPGNKNHVKNLVITNPEKFWGTSKYLVIEGSPEKSGTASSQEKDSEKKY